jgi:hypothetical protein
VPGQFNVYFNVTNALGEFSDFITINVWGRKPTTFL